jgi:hypothetical protein
MKLLEKFENINVNVLMCDEEKKLTESEREKAWELLYDCLHWGSKKSRPAMYDTSKLIVLVNKLLNKK